MKMPSKQKINSKTVHLVRHSVKNQSLHGLHDFRDEVVPTKTDSRSSETQKRMYGRSGMGFRLATKDTMSWVIKSVYQMESMPAPPLPSAMQEGQSPSLPKHAGGKELTQQKNDMSSDLCNLFDAVFNNKASRAA